MKGWKQNGRLQSNMIQKAHIERDFYIYTDPAPLCGRMPFIGKHNFMGQQRSQASRRSKALAGSSLNGRACCSNTQQVQFKLCHKCSLIEFARG